VLGDVELIVCSVMEREMLYVYISYKHEMVGLGYIVAMMSRV
jgi:hypothetical protein